jgi:hypothetical protein
MLIMKDDGVTGEEEPTLQRTMKNILWIIRWMATIIGVGHMGSSGATTRVVAST